MLVAGHEVGNSRPMCVWVTLGFLSQTVLHQMSHFTSKNICRLFFLPLLSHITPLPPLALSTSLPSNHLLPPSVSQSGPMSEDLPCLEFLSLLPSERLKTQA